MIDRGALEALVAGAGPEELWLAGTQLQGRALRALAPAPAPREEPDDNIPVAAAAKMMGISKDYIYKHQTSLPFVATIGKRVVCSARGVEKFLASRRGTHGSR